MGPSCFGLAPPLFARRERDKDRTQVTITVAILPSWHAMCSPGRLYFHCNPPSRGPPCEKTSIRVIWVFVAKQVLGTKIDPVACGWMNSNQFMLLSSRLAKLMKSNVEIDGVQAINIRTRWCGYLSIAAFTPFEPVREIQYCILC